MFSGVLDRQTKPITFYLISQEIVSANLDFYFIVERFIYNNMSPDTEAITKKSFLLNKILFIVICQPNNQNKDYQNGKLDRLFQCLFVFFILLSQLFPSVVSSPKPGSYLHLYFDLYQSIKIAGHSYHLCSEWSQSAWVAA